SHPPVAGAGAIADAATAATARIAAQAHAMPPDTARTVQPHTLAPVDTGGAAQATSTVSAHFAQARTMLDQPPEAPQLHLPARAPAEPSGPQGGVGPQGPGGPRGQGAGPGSAAGPSAAMPNRGA